ncbi:four-carbon acid sugar kinase family protein [Salinisphaera aquimarina]|uniref:Four-carbon acid sugar kinase family protein n=1 Tax=Salinisphaera aquimarina TaxID=2094031 RepID=A0ABV7EUH3_9GAMM
MSRRFVQIVADDLTGALDAAAPFATPDRPVRLLIGRAPAGELSGLAGLTVSSESRDLAGSTGDAALERAFEMLVRAGVPEGRVALSFAKVDSVLRGRPVEETLVRMRLWRTETCLFAPAFPGMGRRTVEGRHETLVDGAWQPAAVHDLSAAFRIAGTESRLRRAEDTRPEMDSGVIIGDASEASHLTGHVAAFARRPDVVWAGSRGLAEAIAGAARPCGVPSLAAVIVGTSHVATRRQIGAAHEAGLFEKVRLIDPVPEAANAEVTRARIADAVAALQPSSGQGLLVVGGDTLASVLSAADAELLDCVGEVAPGVPLSRLRGGRFDGVPLVTKSGGFGAPDLLVRLLG